MHAILSSLSDLDFALLTAFFTLTPDAEGTLWEHLPQEHSTNLRKACAVFKDLPEEQRKAWLQRGAGARFEKRGFKNIERCDPSWIVHHMKGESPKTVAALLVQWPSDYTKSVLRRLPEGVRALLPSKEAVSRLDPVLLNHIRVMFESRFTSMPVPDWSEVRFQSVMHLERPELYALIRDLGLTELAYAFASVGKVALGELCRRLPAADAESLVAAVQRIPAAEYPDIHASQRFLTKVAENFSSTDELLQKAGLWRLAKAVWKEPSSFWHALSQRIPVQAGMLLLGYLDKMEEILKLTVEDSTRTQEHVLKRVLGLSKKGVLNPRWNQLAGADEA